MTSSREGFVFGAQDLHGNPYDGHTLTSSLSQASRLCGGRTFARAYVDRGYRGHGYQGPTEIYICSPGTGKKRSRSLRHWCRRRSTIEPMIGHMKNDGRLGRNYLPGKDGDRMNVVLSVAGQNLRLILAKLVSIPGRLFFLLSYLVTFFRQIFSAVTKRTALAV